MVQYTQAVSKTWTLNDQAGYAKGNLKGTEAGNPNFANQVVLECELGDNLIGTDPRNWNPSFEIESQQIGRPRDWALFANAGSEYKQGMGDAYDGTAGGRLLPNSLFIPAASAAGP